MRGIWPHQEELWSSQETVTAGLCVTKGGEGAMVSRVGKGTRAAQGTSEGVTDLSSDLCLLPVGMAIPAEELPVGLLCLTHPWIFTERLRDPGEVLSPPRDSVSSIE